MPNAELIQQILQDDEEYAKACEYAKDDYFMFGIRRTQQEVEREAERLRKQALLRGGFKRP